MSGGPMINREMATAAPNQRLIFPGLRTKITGGGRKGRIMIDVKQAVTAALRAAEAFYEGKQLLGVVLEEVSRNEDEKDWLITLGFYLPEERPASGLSDMLLKAQGGRFERKYKVFVVDGETGEVESMKIRQL